jgi:hypothetical protein
MAYRNGDAGFEAGRSPLAGILGTGWCDGFTEGFARRHDGLEYHFKMIDEDYRDGGPDLRSFRFLRVPEGSLDRIEAAFAPFHTPYGPFWVPIWRFPTPDDQSRLERLIEDVEGQALAPIWLIASDDLTSEIRLGRRVSEVESSTIEDWFSFLRLDRAAVMS